MAYRHFEIKYTLTKYKQCAHNVTLWRVRVSFLCLYSESLQPFHFQFMSPTGKSYQYCCWAEYCFHRNSTEESYLYCKLTNVAVNNITLCHGKTTMRSINYCCYNKTFLNVWTSSDILITWYNFCQNGASRGDPVSQSETKLTFRFSFKVSDIFVRFRRKIDFLRRFS
jgi:hypothetical protein